MEYRIYFEGYIDIESEDEDTATQEAYDRLKEVTDKFKITEVEEE